MDIRSFAESVTSRIDGERLLEVTLASIRIPSHTYKEHDLADFYADHFSGMGLEVEMIEFEHPLAGPKALKQPVGRFRGLGGGPTLMLNGHMDTIPVVEGWTVDPHGGLYEDGWIWGLGAHDDKGGIAAATCAIEALMGEGISLRGDVLICPVVAHKTGGLGTRELLKRGTGADYCINIEHSTNTVATACVGLTTVRIVTRSPGLHFRYTPEARAAYFNAIEQQAEIIRRLGPSIDRAASKRWLTFKPHADLPGFPVHRLNTIHKDKSTRASELLLEVRTVPGQTSAQINADLEAVLAAISRDHSSFEYELSVPADGADDPGCFPPCEIAKDHPLATAMAEGQLFASGREAEVGGVLRLGNVGDGNITAAAGIPSIQYGPGDMRLYAEWPGPDERVRLEELLEASRAFAYAVCKLCA